MKVNDKTPRGSQAPKAKKRKAATNGSFQITLTPAEKELLLKACMKYRYTIPAYIQSAQPEADRLNGIIEKLS